MAWFGDTKIGRLGRFFGNRGTLVGYWQLNGSSIDNSGNGNNGSDANMTYVGGKFGKSAYFNGSNSQISISKTETDYAEFTEMMWLSTTYTGTSYPYISNFAQSGNNGNLGLYIANTGTGILGMNGSRNGFTSDLRSGAGYNDGKPHLICAVYSYSKMTASLYIDAVLVASEALSSPTYSYVAYQNVWVGSNNGAPYMPGTITELAALSEALSPALISQYYAWATRKPLNWVHRILTLLPTTWTGAGSVTMMNAASRFATANRVYTAVRSAAVTMMNAAGRFATALHVRTWYGQASVSMMNAASRFATVAKSVLIKISGVFRWDFSSWD